MTSVDLPPTTGNGLVVVHDKTVVVDRDLRDSVGERWYWHIGLRGTGVVRVRTARPGLAGGFGPAVSRDGGRTYHWAEDSYAVRREFDLTLDPKTVVLVSPTIPYGSVRLWRFIGRHRSEFTVGRLTSSESGRDVPLIVVGAARRARRRLVLTARHHSCEALGSELLEAIVRALLEARSEGVGWAADTEILAVPFVDVDGVVHGDQGKGRLPHDHNRDYGSVTRYESVRALRRSSIFDGIRCIALDLHTPGLLGPLEERPFLVASGDHLDFQRMVSLATAIGGPRTVQPAVMIFDDEWNSVRANGLRGFAAWARSHPTVVLATSVEYPNAVVRGTPVTSDVVQPFARRTIAALQQLFV